ncbi:MAG: DNA methyltransferase [Candidatus Saccharibacteria bacterium]|nr:DNA methyltransferase [Candidatus Saccharibacteria bacterium]
MAQPNPTKVLKPDATCKINYRNKVDGLKLLSNIKDESLKVVFFDPQYRGILDKMQYGNEGKKRGQARSALTQMSEEVIIKFLKEIERVLKNDGYLFLWVDKFHLVSGIMSWFLDIETMDAVDMIVWDKQKIGMGYRTRRKCEYLVVMQKAPRHAKATWVVHNIPDVWGEKTVKTHPHSKPVELQKQLIYATTEIGDFVCDPASGGYSVFKACEETGRNFIGGDILYGED